MAASDIMDTYTIYFADVSVVITSQPLPSIYSVMECDDELRISRTNLVKKAETDKYIAVLTPDVERTMASLAAQFVQVEAAGGVAVDGLGRRLLICRNGRWESVSIRDVPVGSRIRVRPGERIALDGHVISGHSAVDQSPITGESMPGEEGIVAAEWVDDAEVRRRIKMSFPTIREVFRTLYEREGRTDAVSV